MKFDLIKVGYQKTLSHPVTFSGIGVHQGKEVSMTLVPAPPCHGIQFVRTDIKNGSPIQAVAENVSSTFLSTRLEGSGYSIDTVEHLMATLSALSIDNLLIYVTESELPIMDGSSKDFMKTLINTPLITQLKPKFAMRINEAITIKDINGEKRCTITPSRNFSLKIVVDFKEKFIGKDSYFMESLNIESFSRVADARTFGFTKDLLRVDLSQRGKGSSLDNTLIFHDDGLDSRQTFRMSQEPIKHKTLDAIGDLALLGFPLIANVEIYKPGHTINQQITRKLRNAFLETIEQSNIPSEINATYSNA